MSNNLVTLINSVSDWKQGYKTSEFWVALVPVLSAALSIFGVHLGNSQTTHLLIVVWGAVAVVYIAARSFLKAVHLGHAVNLAALIHTAESEVKNIVAEAPKPVG